MNSGDNFVGFTRYDLYFVMTMGHHEVTVHTLIYNVGDMFVVFVDFEPIVVSVSNPDFGSRLVIVEGVEFDIETLARGDSVNSGDLPRIGFDQ